MRQIAWTGNSVVSQPGTWGVGELETWSLSAGASGWTNGPNWTKQLVAPQSGIPGEELQSPAIAGAAAR
jgi:hypothetical protein